jgi:hypothetical protein
LTEQDNEAILCSKDTREQEKTVISTIVNNLLSINKICFAQTGRCKVIANYSEKPAFTIHKKIYFPRILVVACPLL